MAQEKLSARLKANFKIQVAKWDENSKSNPSLAYMEVQVESLKQLKAEAFKLATKLEWTVDTFGISSAELDDLIIDIKHSKNMSGFGIFILKSSVKFWTSIICFQVQCPLLC